MKVTETWLASSQVAGLRGPARRAYETFLDDLASRGCAALGYRVTGPEPLPRLCVKHLRGNDRVVVAFENRSSAWVLLVGPHEDGDPGRNVYDRLYELAGVTPPPSWKRTRPSCCSETGEAPLTSPEVVDDLVLRARAVGRKHRNQFRR